MKFGFSPRLGRAVLVTLAGLLVAGGTLAQTARPAPGRTIYSVSAPRGRLDKPLSRYSIADLPLQRLRPEEAREWVNQLRQFKSGSSLSTRAPAPPPVVPQHVDITTNPRPPRIGPSTRCIEIQPFWSWDQQSIYLSSNNVDTDVTNNYGLTTPPGNAPFHIYRVTSDGSFVQQVTGTAIAGEATGNQFFPALNHAQTKLAYVHRDNPAQPFQLYVLDFFTGQRTQLTGITVLNNPLNADIVNPERPTWSPFDDRIVFAARNRNIPGDPRNLYSINLVSRVVTQLTFGSPGNGIECFDPVFHPDAPVGRITFASNAAAINGGTGDINYAAGPKPLQDLRGDGIADDRDRDIFSIPQLGPTPGNPVRRIISGPSDDIEPAHQQADDPVGNGRGFYNNWLAWASLGRKQNPGNPLEPIGTTYDIFFNDGNPDIGGGEATPLRLFTPDTNAGAIPLNQTDERYPTWSSSMTVSNPIDRLAYSANIQTVVNGDVATIQPAPPGITDIWTSQVDDFTPPTLLTFDEDQGETLHIANAPLPNQGRRIGVPGEPFYFYARVKDGQYGVESVWIQIKDPDGQGTDFQGVERKLYGFGNNHVFVIRRASDGTAGATHLVHIPMETDYQGLGVTDYQYYNTALLLDFANVTDGTFASFIPGVDDAIAWSGNQPPLFNGQLPTNRPPTDGSGGERWLRLRDDGVFPDLVAGDDVYSASWVTPNFPSDFYVDLIAYDKASNPKDSSQQGNWVIFDNIWGFSTQAHVSQHPILLVDDYGCGQKWPRGIRGAFRAFPTYRYGTESDIVDRPVNRLRQEVFGGMLRGLNDPAIGFMPPRVSEELPFLPTNSFPFNSTYNRSYKADVWRILAKGPVPETVLNDYVPTVEVQPRLAGSSFVEVNQPIPRRAVVWNSPYTGDVFAGAGTLLDQRTQSLLTTYRNRAGRLLVAGGDILWALTVDGSVSQTFVTDVLGAGFAPGDDSGTQRPMSLRDGGPIALDVTLDVFRSFNPLPTPPYWGPEFDPDIMGHACTWPNIDQSQNIGGNPQTIPNLDRSVGDGTPFQQQDRLQPQPDWEVIYQNHMIGRNDPQRQSKTIFMSTSLASLSQRLIAEGDDAAMMPLHSMNYKSKVSHAMFCWMFSTELAGQIRNLNGGGPVPGALVETIQGGTVGAAFSRVDGNYIIRGIPVGGYNLRVTSPGFLAFNKSTGDAAHGLGQTFEDVFLVPAAPGSISGRVVDTFNTPIPNARLQATINPVSPLYPGVRDFFATTQADGTYILPNLPTATYDVRVVQPFPNLFTNPTPDPRTGVQVLPAQDTPGINFTMQGQPGPLQVKVFPQLGDGTADRNNPIEGAEVTLLQGGTPLPGFTALTDATGTVNFSNVPAGPITVTGFKLGFQEQSASISIPQNDFVELLLPAAPPRALYGIVVRDFDGQELTSADLTPPVLLDLIRPTSGLPVGIQASVFSPAQTNPVRHNYFFPNAQEGRFNVGLLGHPRWLPASVTVTITATEPNVAPVLRLVGRDGILSGSVFEDVNGSPGSPIGGATITIADPTSGNVQATATSAADGTWQTATTIPTGLYRVTVSKFGYSNKVITPDVFVAGDTDTGPTLLLRAPRGQVYGLARRGVDLVPRDNVTIQFVPQQFPNEVRTTVSFLPPVAAPDAGLQNYTIGDTQISSDLLPQGVYNVLVTGDQRFQDFAGVVTVLGGQAVRFDINLVPKPGVLSGQVRERNQDGSPGVPVVNATVTIRNGPNVVSVLATDNNGNYQTPAALPAALYTITASAFGYLDNSVQAFVEGDTVAPLILLSPVPPVSVLGTVRSSLDNSVIDGVLMELLYPVGQTAGPPLPPPATSTDTITGNPARNYVLTPVRPGTYRVRASKPGWKTQTINVTVSPGADRIVNFLLDPDQVFGRGLLLISLPYDLPGEDAAALFGISPAVFKSAYWLTDQNRYAIYPEPEAREFRLGKGMFVRFTQATAFTRGGTPAPDVTFALPVKAGWNSIGAVRRQRIEWLRVRVADSQGNVFTMQQAYDQGLIQNGIWSYVDGYFRSDFLDPFSGYYVRAFQDCTLLIPVDNSTASLPAPSARYVAMGPPRPAPSPAQVAAELALAGMGPAGSEQVTTVLRRSLPAPRGSRSPWSPELVEPLVHQRKARPREG